METQAPMCKGSRKPMAEYTSPVLLLQLLGFASLLNVPKRPLSPPLVSRVGRFVVATLLLEMDLDPHLSERPKSTACRVWPGSSSGGQEAPSCVYGWKDTCSGVRMRV